MRASRHAGPARSRSATFGHVGDSNLHFAMTIGDAGGEDHREAMHIGYDELRPYGGSISAEHGIGLEKRPYLGYCRSEEEIVLMRALKNALDPAGILNPGKVVA